MVEYGSVGELIEERMRQRGLTQQQVAEESGMAQTSVSRLKSNRDPFYLPTLAARLKLGPILGITDEEWMRAAHQFHEGGEPEIVDPRDRLMRLREEISNWGDVDPEVRRVLTNDIDWVLGRLSTQR